MSGVPANRPKPSTRMPKRRLRAKKGEQLTLAKTGGWGGKRPNAGRKPAVGERSHVTHAKRPVHKGRHPIHITLRAKPGLPSFRQERIHTLFAEVLRDQRRRAYKDEFRVIHFSIQTNHLHLIVEADSERAEEQGCNAVRCGVSGLKIALARRLNMMLGRTGAVWEDRYHRHDLKTPRETVHGLGYLFENFTHHGEWSFGDGVVDVHSSAWLFEGWDTEHFVFDEAERWRWPVCPAETWMLREGWKKHGPLAIHPRHP